MASEGELFDVSRFILHCSATNYSTIYYSSNSCCVLLLVRFARFGLLGLGFGMISFALPSSIDRLSVVVNNIIQ